MTKRLIIVLLAACQLAGCASASNRAALENYRIGCAQGNANACRSVPYQEAVNKAEAGENALKGVAIAILLPLFVLAAMGQAQQAQEGPAYVVRRCYNC